MYWQGGDESVERISSSQRLRSNYRVGIARLDCFGRARAQGSQSRLLQPALQRELHRARRIGRAISTRSPPEQSVIPWSDQKACIASLVHYIEGSVEDAERYAAAVERALDRWDAQMPHPLLNRHRATKTHRTWRASRCSCTFPPSGRRVPLGGCRFAPHDFAIRDHPMCRLIVVRPVSNLDECLRFLHPGVATVGIYPDSCRLALRDRVAARGVSNVVPLGHAGRSRGRQLADGMLVLSELVDWKNG